jgi:hypothetical protein
VLRSLCHERGLCNIAVDVKAADGMVRPLLGQPPPSPFGTADARGAWEMGRMIAKEKGLTLPYESTETKGLTAADAVRFYEQ